MKNISEYGSIVEMSVPIPAYLLLLNAQTPLFGAFLLLHKVLQTLDIPFHLLTFLIAAYSCLTAVGGINKGCVIENVKFNMSYMQ